MNDHPGPLDRLLGRLADAGGPVGDWAAALLADGEAAQADAAQADADRDREPAAAG